MNVRRPLLLLALLVPLSAAAFDEVQVRDPAALADVRSVYVAPVVVALPEEVGHFDRRFGQERPVTPADAQARALDLAAALRRGLARDHLIADAPGPGVLVVYPILTGLVASRPTMADFHQVPGLSFRSVYAGGASVTLRLERDGQEVAVLADRYVGTFGDGRPRIGIWQDTDRAFQRWSSELAQFVGAPQAALR